MPQNPHNRADVHLGRHRPRRGLTLVEVTIVVMALGILAAAAYPRLADNLHRSRVDAAAKRIAADLKLARQQAMTKSTTQQVSFTTLTNRYTLPGIADLSRSATTYTVLLADHPYRVTLTSASLGGDALVQFNMHGVPDSGGVITVSSGGQQQTVSIHATSGVATVP